METQTAQPAEHVIHVPNYPSPIVARKMVIASVHFEERNIQFMHSNRQTFNLKAAPKGEVSYLSVYDSTQFVPQWPSNDGEPMSAPMPVPVETIMKDLEDNWGWAILKSGPVRLGIMRIAGDTCTEKEKQNLIKLEELACRRAVEEADSLHQTGDPKARALIQPFHRACLEWLGSERRPWYHQIELGNMKVGPLSGTRIPMEALSDAGQNLLAFYAQSGLDPAEFGDTFIADLFKKKPELKGRMGAVEVKK